MEEESRTATFVRIKIICSSSRLAKETERLLAKQEVLNCYKIEIVDAKGSKNLSAYMQHYFQNMSADLIFALVPKEFESLQDYKELCRKIDGLYTEGASGILILSLRQDAEKIFELKNLSVHEQNLKDLLLTVSDPNGKWICDTVRELEDKSFTGRNINKMKIA